MAARKTSSRSSSKVATAKPRSMESEFVEEETINTPIKTRSPISPILLAIPFIIALLALVLWKNKGWVVAATVNNQPIWRWDLEQKFVSRYGTPTLDEMVNEQILKSEAAKEGISVTSKDIDNKIVDIQKTLQGKVTLKDALAQQGMTMDDFRHQVELQVLIEKLTANKVKVTGQEVADYIAKNKDTMTATDEAGMNAEAKDALLQQKRSAEFQTIFDGLKKSAKVTKFL